MQTIALIIYDDQVLRRIDAVVEKQKRLETTKRNKGQRAERMPSRMQVLNEMLESALPQIESKNKKG